MTKSNKFYRGGTHTEAPQSFKTAEAIVYYSNLNKNGGI